ncbi:MAG TPA: BatA and WFA domain-containing protein [Gemmatimonadales bacterium]|nr:BatA and WFA domain-containing protein [Gemmatimonadales bacterium]
MIGWLHPWALTALGAAAIPLLLHLVTRRDPPVVVFPAVRYLVAATREHQRRLRLRHWLLLLVRTLLILALVLAAAGPSLPRRGTGAGHTPTAMVLVLDNSLSSGAVAGGTPVIATLIRAAREVLDRATPEDQLWLLTADGVPRRGDRSQLGLVLDSLGATDRRLDLGAALTTAATLLSADRRPGEIVLVSDVQASALSPATVPQPILVVRPVEAAPPNAGIARLDPGPLPWTGDAGHLRLELVGDPGKPIPLTATLGNRPPRQLLATPGTPAEIVLPVGAAGWWTVAVRLAADELRADDSRTLAVRVARPARVHCDATENYLVAACATLLAGGRVASGTDVEIGQLGPGPSVVVPPADPALIGALNRALDARGVGWHYGVLSSVPVQTDSGAWLGRTSVSRRYGLTPTGNSRAGILATAGGEPWLVRGEGVVLVGSRFDPAWTRLPVEADFVPLVDALANRLARNPLWLLDAAPGDAVLLPDATSRVASGSESWPVEGGAAFRPPRLGIYYLLAGPDTIGALSANPDPRESQLLRATDRELQTEWPGAILAAPDEAGGRAFTGAARSDLRGPLLWLALACGFMEVALASIRRSAA